MPFVIFDPEKNLYRSMQGDENWSSDINQSAVFRSEKNANEKIKDQIRKWKRYSESWVGHPNHPNAINTLKIHSRSTVKQIKFVLESEA